MLVKKLILILLSNIIAINIIATPNKPIHKLLIPCLEQSDVIRKDIIIKPYRFSGIRLALEHVMNGKMIVHNYGHGILDVTASWGCAEVAVEMMKEELKRLKRQSTKKIAVIGAGIIGLTMAYVLAEKGYRVTVYAQDFASNTKSYQSFGFIDGEIVIEQGQASLNNRIRSLSFARFKNLAAPADSWTKSVMYKKHYVFGIKQEALMKNFQELNYEITPVCVALHDGKERQGCFYNGLWVDVQQYMQDLVTQLQTMGVALQQYVLHTMHNLDTLSEKVICNCLGADSGQFFQDDAIIPMKTQVLYVKPNQDVDYVLFDRHGMKSTGTFVSYIATPRYGIVGGIVEFDNNHKFTDDKIYGTILANVCNWFGLPQKQILDL